MARVVITGGNRGIGLQLARLYAATGHDVVIGARQPPPVAVPQAGFAALDVADGASIERFAAALGAGPVDILINNAGIIGPARQSALDMDFDGFLETLVVNTLGPLRVTQALLPALRRSAGAKLAIISSQMGSMSAARSGHVAYRASKAAVNKVGQCLAADLAGEGVAIAMIHPGWVRTDMGGPGADIAPEESAEGIMRVIDALSPASSGRFWNYDGGEMAW
ncbi:SDR family oxidoreductase [Sphingomonas sp.]|uniref:SDR family oxidoreductase n=1 Tax=Sphingomonas sp. TaxID=28214 RepID=UPI001DC3AB7E|nr:SDR family oxidoreductase [Sphingomonas sp.]MBX9796409.1 SDR family oxidoreductase [Sphingomonas sp.]